MMKGAIEVADIVTTVSKTYASELHYPYYAHRLDGVLRKAWLWGITNGIDTTVFNPETDPALKFNYSAKKMAGKSKLSSAIQYFPVLLVIHPILEGNQRSYSMETSLSSSSSSS